MNLYLHVECGNRSLMLPRQQPLLLVMNDGFCNSFAAVASASQISKKLNLTIVNGLHRFGNCFPLRLCFKVLDQSISVAL